MPELEVIDLTELTESSGSDREEEEDEDSEISDDEEIIVNDVSRMQLHAAIATVSEHRLREVVTMLVDNIPAVERAMTKELVTLKRKTRELVTRWETCVNCNEEFDVNTHRADDECSFHPGELEVDEEGFVDWDEDCHGPMDTTENRRQYPENFLWSCCEVDGQSVGCVQGEHSTEGPRKKRRT